MLHRHIQCSSPAAVLWGALVLASSATGETAELRGFTRDAAASERQWEEKLRAIPRADHIREYMEYCAQAPHHAGGEGSKKVARYILSK